MTLKNLDSYAKKANYILQSHKRLDFFVDVDT